MNNLIPISKLIYEHDGGYFNIIGTRKWYLEAYDNQNKLICKLNQDNNDNHNYITYVKFIKLLRNSGYKLRESDIIEITENTMKKNFLLEYFLKYVQKSHIYEIGEINNYSKSYINNIKYESDEKKNEFIQFNGLQKKHFDLFINKL
tara:strand:- start:861 stop:1301 length:441 start_codon:yes stop_codon:yes gene_type:complete